MKTHVTLTKIQRDKLKRGEGTIRLKPAQLNGNDDQIHVTIRNSNKLNKARANNCGCQIKAKLSDNNSGDGLYLLGEKPRTRTRKTQAPVIVIKKKTLPGVENETPKE